MNNFTQEDIHDIIMFFYDLLYTNKHEFKKHCEHIEWFKSHKDDFDNQAEYLEALEIAENLKDGNFKNIGRLTGFIKKFNDMLGGV